MFSCVTGILGVAVVAWYGFADLEKAGTGSGSLAGAGRGTTKGTAEMAGVPAASMGQYAEAARTATQMRFLSLLPGTGPDTGTEARAGNFSFLRGNRPPYLGVG